MKTLYILYVAYVSVSALVIHSAHAKDRDGQIIGYNCAGTGMNMTTISLEAIEPCHMEQKSVTVTKERIQLIQLADAYPVRVTQCKVTVGRLVTHCGMHSHASVTRGGTVTYVYPIRRDQCMEAHRTGELALGKGVTLSALRVNNTETGSVTFAGQVSYDGSCTGAYYSDQFGEWDNVVVTGHAIITLTEYLAYVDTDTGLVRLNDGTSCKTEETHCIDSLSGYTFWETPKVTQCDEKKHMVLYEGSANKFLEHEDGKDVITYSVTTKKKSFGLRITTQYEQCQFLSYHTEHPKLVIVPSNGAMFFFQQGSTNPNMLDLMAYMNSKFVYVEKALKERMNELYTRLSYQRCVVERKSLMNLQSIASIVPTEFAYAYTGRPGVTAAAIGEVIHMTYCNPVEVQIRPTERCYKEMPVTYGDTPYYLTPKSHLLQKYGTEIDCDSRLNAWYKIGKDWVSFTKTHHLAPEPVKLMPNKTTPLPTRQLHLAVSGIYSHEDTERLREKLMNPYEKAAISNTITRGVVGMPYDPQGTNVYHLLSDDSLTKIKDTIAYKIWGWITVFGNVTSGLIGVFIIVRIIKFILDTIIHMRGLYEIYGFSAYILGGIWDSVTTYLLTRQGWKPSCTNKDVELGILNNAESQQKISGNPSAPDQAIHSPMYPSIQQPTENENSTGTRNYYFPG